MQPASAEYTDIEIRQLLEDIRYCDRFLRRDSITSVDAADITAMRISKLEKLIKAKHKQAICKRNDRDIWYTRNPEDSSKKISANSLTKLYEKLFVIYYGEQNYTVADLYPIWSAWHARRRGLVDLSVRRYDQQFRKYICDSDLGQTQVSAVKGSDIEIFFSDLVSRIHRHDLTNIKTILNGIFDYAVANDYIQVNLARQYNTRSIKTVAERHAQDDVFTDEDRILILNHLEQSDNTYDLAICLMFCLCCRIGELRALHWEDINWGKMKIRIHREIVKRKGEDGKLHEVEVPHTKTGRDSGVRLLNISPRAQRILQKAAKLNNGAGYIFTSTPEGSSMSYLTFNRHLKKACREVGIEERSSHKIRFWAASSMAANGADISTLMANGGWSDKSTALHYQRRVAVGQKTDEIWNKSFN